MPLTPEQTARLADLEAQFDDAGSRGVDLADEIDRLRFQRDKKTATLTLKIDWLSEETDDPAAWNWADLLDMDPTRVTVADAAADEPVYVLSRSDVDAQAGRTVTDDEVDTLRKALEYSSLSDVVSDVVWTVVGTAGDPDSDPDLYEPTSSDDAERDGATA